MRELKCKGCPSLGEGPKVGCISKHFSQGNLPSYHISASTIFYFCCFPSPGGQVTYHLAHELLWGNNFDGHQWFEKDGFGLARPLLETQRTCNLESHFLGPGVRESTGHDHIGLFRLTDEQIGLQS